MGAREKIIGAIKRVLPTSDESVLRSLDQSGALNIPKKVITGTLIDNGGCAPMEALDNALVSRKFNRNMGFRADQIVRYGIKLGFLEGRLTTEGPEICLVDFSTKPQAVHSQQ